jgi:hypothetical protein
MDPEDLKRRVNLRAGEDRGRIYRVYPKGAKLRRPPRLDALSGAALVEAMNSANGCNAIQCNGCWSAGVTRHRSNRSCAIHSVA